MAKQNENNTGEHGPSIQSLLDEFSYSIQRDLANGRKEYSAATRQAQQNLVRFLSKKGKSD